MVSLVLSLILATPVFVVFWLWRPKVSTKPLPPGPKPWPIIGNALDMPREKEWLTFTEWRKTHGDIVSLSVFGRRIIILNSAKAAVELLDKRSSHYSDRPHLTMATDMIGYDHVLILVPYGERFRKMRRIFHQVLSPRPAQAFWSVEEQETSRFLSRLLEAPEKFPDHIRHTAGAIILKVSHGYTVAPTQDKLVDLAEKALEQFCKASTPGAFLVDVVPWLKYIPAWFPGAGFKRTAAEWRKDLFDMADTAHEFTVNEMKKGTALPSVTSKNMERAQTSEDEFLVKWTALSMYGGNVVSDRRGYHRVLISRRLSKGGADTSVAAVKTFFLAMCTHPDVQAIAQAELDAVVGQGRLPTMTDRPSLPYIEAIFKEVLRWGPVVPAVPHRVTREDEYEGYRIPEGSFVWGNIWCMLQDPEIYPEPSQFRPERFLGPNKVGDPLADPLRLAFGFGRRVCPGQNLAEPSVFLSIAMTLATFTISKACDDAGRVIEPELEWTSGSISHPKPFRCEIKPRSPRAVELIKQAVASDRT